MVSLLLGELDAQANVGPYVDGVPLPGEFGLLLATCRRAIEDCREGAWYTRLESAHWLIYTLPDLLSALLNVTPATTEEFVAGIIPIDLVEVADMLTPDDVQDLATLVATDGWNQAAKSRADKWRLLLVKQ